MRTPLPSVQLAAIAEVVGERDYQDDKWGSVAELPADRTAEFWFLILSEEVGEIANSLLEGEASGTTLAEVVQVAAVCLAWLEWADINHVGLPDSRGV